MKGKTDKRRKAEQVGRVDYRALAANRSTVFADRRTRRARTRGAAERRAIAEAGG
jgi:hypothetical protein